MDCCGELALGKASIYNDAWLSGREQNRVSAQHIMPNWTTVNQLIESETSTWKRELVYNLFDGDTVARILSIPISDGGREDLRVWKHDGSGIYTVRSGYRVLNSAHLQVSSLISPNEGDYISFYKALWSLDIPGKIKIHNWRLFNNMLPHFGNLARRTLRVGAGCPLCKSDLEDSSHLMWDCDMLKRVWASLQVRIPNLAASLSCKSRFAFTFSAVDEHQRRVTAIST
ncbi:hypothetical protein J1N35_033193 [Gossypium stocksii]|uniref:Reverse transcriptase zinc-binding domain-containing protein n=1 Tax=Gossypium stocksii TaxID=47602 RepID=A0A9D3UPK7_9ROSI|nr:hypothetical protein J1N35_033193 [Gossypium stocksii]